MRCHAEGAVPVLRAHLRLGMAGLPTWVRLWRFAITRDDPDVVLILVGRWETMDRKLNERWTHVGEPDLNAHLRSRLEKAITIAGAHGARVVLATQRTTVEENRPTAPSFPRTTPSGSGNGTSFCATSPHAKTALSWRSSLIE